MTSTTIDSAIGLRRVLADCRRTNNHHNQWRVFQASTNTGFLVLELVGGAVSRSPSTSVQHVENEVFTRHDYPRPTNRRENSRVRNNSGVQGRMPPGGSKNMRRGMDFLASSFMIARLFRVFGWSILVRGSCGLKIGRNFNRASKRPGASDLTPFEIMPFSLGVPERVSKVEILLVLDLLP